MKDAMKKLSMFCPSCGGEGQQAKAYCKRCGEWLPDLKARSRAFGGDTPQQNLFTSLFMSVSSAVFALFAAIALLATYLGTDDAKWSVYLAATFCLCIFGWQVASIIAGIKLSRRLGRGKEKSTPEQIDAQKPAVLNPADLSAFVNTASVTENTTEPLESVPERYPNWKT